jgi:hypothetical protein
MIQLTVGRLLRFPGGRHERQVGHYPVAGDSEVAEWQA